MAKEVPRRGYVISLLAAACAVSASCTVANTTTGASARPSAPRVANEHTTPHEPVTSKPPALFEALVERERHAALARSGEAVAVLPASLRDLEYDAYRSIRFRKERSLWSNEPGQFEVEFLHPGRGYSKLIQVHEVHDEMVVPFPFSVHLFTYGALTAPESGAGLGFTGLRIHAPINRPDYRDEIIVFQGASYFRSLGSHQGYGMSARGLAVDLGEPTPEEFPVFEEFYLVRPAPHDAAIWVMATLKSERAHGVYAFEIEPGATTVVDVHARLWITSPVTSLGLAPLSSMFLFGEDEPAAFGDFRPEVHDADLMVSQAQNGEQLARPLRNPAQTVRSDFRLDSPRGFGLLQRDRRFESYQDLECHYENRPSVWIEPLGDWGPGVLRLLEIATRIETDDNIALAWVPESPPQGELALRYRLHFGAQLPVGGMPNRVVATRLGTTARGARFVVDFEGPDLVQAPAELQAHVEATGAKVVDAQVMQGLPDGGVRMAFEAVSDEPGRDVELRGSLRRGSKVVTETWSYRWQARP